MGLSSDVVTVTAPVSYMKFQVPNFARLHVPPRPKQAGMQELPAIPLSEVPDAAFHQLVSSWVNDMYRKAGKEPLPTAGRSCAA